MDRIVPSLDASNEEEFRLVNRPAPGLRFEQFVADLTDFTHHTDADLYLELFILPGVNDSDESIQRFVELISKMKLTMVQLNTLDRPGTESWVKPSPAENTRRFIRALEPIVPVEAVGPFRYRSRSREHAPELCTGAERAILDLVERRPATLADLTVALGLPQEEIQILLDSLFKFGLLEMEKQERGTFYAPARH